MSLLAQLRQSTQRILLSMFIVVSAILLMLAKADIRLIQTASDQLADGGRPILSWLAKPIVELRGLAQEVGRILAVHEENQRLREENSRLLAWKARAVRLQVQNGFLNDIVDLRVDEHLSRSVTARIVADSASVFVQSRLLDAGKTSGIETGMAVVDAAGMVGHITNVGDKSSRLLLLTDFNSRVPVFVGKAGEQAILQGNNTELLELAFLPDNPFVQNGDEVMTSGTGGILPTGIPIGRLKGQNGRWLVEPYVDWTRLDYVSVINGSAVVPPNVQLADLPQ